MITFVLGLLAGAFVGYVVGRWRGWEEGYVAGVDFVLRGESWVG